MIKSVRMEQYGEMMFDTIIKLKDINNDIPSNGEIFMDLLGDMRFLIKGENIPPWATKEEIISAWRDMFTSHLRETRIPMIRRY